MMSVSKISKVEIERALAGNTADEGELVDWEIELYQEVISMGGAAYPTLTARLSIEYQDNEGKSFYDSVDLYVED
jgi:hypothetical protein